jgi:hypothetical protein
MCLLTALNLGSTTAKKKYDHTLIFVTQIPIISPLIVVREFLAGPSLTELGFCMRLYQRLFAWDFDTS